MGRYLFIPAILLIVVFFEFKKPISITERIYGVSLVAPRDSVDDQSLMEASNIGAGWVAIIPFGFIGDSTGTVHFNTPRQWWGERTEGIEAVVGMARKQNLRIMLKPHVWIRGQGWPGDYQPSTAEEWSIWESTYRDYILFNAELANRLGVELFCVGTEFRKTATLRPEFWRGLIADVRKKYRGKLTYAANWDNFENIEFWDDLDYMGIDAYFPVSEERVPGSESLSAGWEEPVEAMAAAFDRWEKPILFTEFGYRSVDYAADGHWKHDYDAMPENMEAQAAAYQGLFDHTWNQPWMAGGFLWKWHMSVPERYRARLQREYTPQGKPAEKVIKEAFASGNRE